MQLALATMVLLLLVLAGMFGVYQIFGLISARASGWRQLATRFRASAGRAPGPLLPLPKARIQGVVYRNVLAFRASEAGLLLRPWWLDRPTHATLLLPWTAVQSARAEPLGKVLAQGLSGGPAAAQILIRLGLKQISKGLYENPSLRNVVLELPGEGPEPLELELIVDQRELLPFLPQLQQS